MGLAVDTSALVTLERANREPDEPAREHAEELIVPMIVWGELLLGVHLAEGAHAARRRAWLERARALLRLVPIDEPVIERYAALRADPQRAGTPIPTNDFLIAATALALEFGVLVSPLNEAHYRKVPGLRVELLRLAA